ncbi:pyrroline-5-carboxylate reductase [Halobacteroides halobius DSM 5150]|uniref:Pyrroline-5-carboxylate reductase n=1 Tax=Halobacteroides halobius (strain ATCC 35273 / DSM 5150 / MD-1) TaxID=748449 RepID=L0K6E8_HALHC|nr:pyrroline-5-carboxylate reductase [Halobacteroides halobius]AGB40817.1 pyrroline-5-carboxylate reductase [Halobacteroides halobius DSM 5150]
MVEKIGFIGAGSMAEALITGILEAELFSADRVYISDINQERVESLHNKYQVQIANNNQELVKQVDYIVLAVKPRVVKKILGRVGQQIRPYQKLFSIAAGVTTKQLEKHLSTDVPVVRLMPNTPALIGSGATAYTLGQAATEDASRVVKEIFSSVGLIVEVKEDLMDAVTGLSGSGPAYIYMIVEALSDAGVNVGLPRKVASKLAIQTLLGAGEMVQELEKHPAQLKDLVTSPGGTTITGLKELEKTGLRSSLYQAVESATAKSKELRGE